MKRIKLVLIHLADMFDNYIIHNIFKTNLVNYDWVFDLSQKICFTICESDWWGEDPCKCRYCYSMQYGDDI